MKDFPKYLFGIPDLLPKYNQYQVSAVLNERRRRHLETILEKSKENPSIYIYKSEGNPDLEIDFTLAEYFKEDQRFRMHLDEIEEKGYTIHIPN